MVGGGPKLSEIVFLASTTTWFEEERGVKSGQESGEERRGSK